MSGYYVSAFQFLSKEVPYVLSIQRYAKRGEEVNASRNLMMKLVKELGEGFIDLIVVDGLYKIKMMKFFKRLGMKTLVKTTENRLEIVKELEGFIRIKADNVKIYEGID
jgi:DNA polymerase/3'-5' exonuclease PolX